MYVRLFDDVMSDDVTAIYIIPKNEKNDLTGCTFLEKGMKFMMTLIRLI